MDYRPIYQEVTFEGSQLGTKMARSFWTRFDTLKHPQGFAKLAAGASNRGKLNRDAARREKPFGMLCALLYRQTVRLGWPLSFHANRRAFLNSNHWLVSGATSRSESIYSFVLTLPCPLGCLNLAFKLEAWHRQSSGFRSEERSLHSNYTRTRSREVVTICPRELSTRVHCGEPQSPLVDLSTRGVHPVLTYIKFK
jgi:hypothetical protein